MISNVRRRSMVEKSEKKTLLMLFLVHSFIGINNVLSLKSLAILNLDSRIVRGD